MLIPRIASEILRGNYAELDLGVVDSNATDLFLNHREIPCQRDFELLMRWMCQRSQYLVFCDADPEARKSPRGFLEDIFGWVECEVSSEVRFATRSPAVWSYFLPCHPGQYEPLMSFMTGLHRYTASSPVEDLAFVGADGASRLVTVSHEELAWLSIPHSELREAESTGQGWVHALSDP